MHLRPNDVLFAMLDELCRQAMTMQLHNADEREAWRAACSQLLQAVPTPEQRLAWSIELAQALAVRGELPVALALKWVRES